MFAESYGRDEYVENDRVFSGADEFIDWTARTPKGKAEWHDTARATPGDAWNRHRRGWHGTDSFEDAVTLARAGWLERVELEMSADTVPFRANNVLDVRHDVSGAFVDVGAYLAGEPMSMLAPYVSQGKPITKIAIQLVTSGIMSSETLLKNARIMAAAVDVLTVAGHAVEITMFGRFGPCNDHYWNYVVPIKHANEAMDLSAIAFWLGHPSVQRRFLFGALEQESIQHRAWAGAYSGGGYGHVPFDVAPCIDADIVILDPTETEREMRRLIERTNEDG